MSISNQGVDIIIRDLKLNPMCIHGPTILFLSRSDNKKYFSCAGIRNQKCFYLDFESNKSDKVVEDTSKVQVNCNEVTKVNFLQVCKNRIYCKTCRIFVSTLLSHESHDFIRGSSNEALKEPSLFLPQLDDDKFNAQYFFDDNTLDFLCSTFECLKLKKIICIGAPRLHDFIRSKKPNLQSVLMDIDERFRAFNHPTDFIHYNMFNHYFFDGNGEEEKLIQFLKDGDPTRSQHCLFTDPPFAARTELLSCTIKQIASLYCRVNAHHKILPVMWIFPYFNECHIKREMPQMEMLDFQVTYMNHQAYRDGFKGRKAGSPVRIFTNIDPTLISYSPRFSNYRLCLPCNRFVSINNRHCNICKTCPSKNGATYRHCNDCIVCVKPNYVHCSKCNRCVQKTLHDCDKYQKNQECWFCSQRGHVEKNCPLTKQLAQRKSGFCVVCKGKKIHNLRKCPTKSRFLKNK